MNLNYKVYIFINSSLTEWNDISVQMYRRSSAKTCLADQFKIMLPDYWASFFKLSVVWKCFCRTNQTTRFTYKCFANTEFLYWLTPLTVKLPSTCTKLHKKQNSWKQENDSKMVKKHLLKTACAKSSSNAAQPL